MRQAKALELIEWEDKSTGINLFGCVRIVRPNAVIVDVIGVDDATVVNHKRYRIVKEAEIDESAAELFKRARRAMGYKKWF